MKGIKEVVFTNSTVELTKDQKMRLEKLSIELWGKNWATIRSITFHRSNTFIEFPESGVAVFQPLATNVNK